MEYTDELVKRALTEYDLSLSTNPMLLQTEHSQSLRAKARAAAMRDALEAVLPDCESNLKATANYAYAQRNALAISLALLAKSHGYNVGYSVDTDSGFDPEWSVVVFVELPGEGTEPAKQLSWHMDPEFAQVAKACLPLYNAGWDGTLLGKDPQRVVELFRELVGRCKP